MESDPIKYNKGDGDGKENAHYSYRYWESEPTGLAEGECRVETYYYDSRDEIVRAEVNRDAASTVAAPVAATTEPPSIKCPDCGGSGSILLLITRRPCARCGGSGLSSTS